MASEINIGKMLLALRELRESSIWDTLVQGKFPSLQIGYDNVAIKILDYEGAKKRLEGKGPPHWLPFPDKAAFAVELGISIPVGAIGRGIDSGGVYRIVVVLGSREVAEPPLAARQTRKRAPKPVVTDAGPEVKKSKQDKQTKLF